ncbi:MAG: carotenoid biosynthesis protein [Nitrospirota bacterium]
MRQLIALLWALVIAYAAVSAVMFAVNPARQILVLIVASVTMAVVHGAMRYGLTDALVFLAWFSVGGFAVENLSVAAGPPFGLYHFTNAFDMPMIGRVPLDVGVMYFAMGYHAWVVGNILLDKADARLAHRFNRIALPVVAAFVMVMWGVVVDPGSATILRVWIWHNGGGYFGVPLINYLGWYVVVYVFFQGFAWYLAARSDRAPIRSHDPGPSYWLPPVVLYLLVAAGAVALYVVSPDTEHADAVGYVWRSKDIYETAVIVSLFTMGFAGVMAVLRLFQPRPDNIR